MTVLPLLKEVLKLEFANIYVMKCVESTNKVAENLCKNQLLEKPTWIFSELQTAGIARRGQKWLSFKGNIHATLILPLDYTSKYNVTSLSFIASLSVYDLVINLLDLNYQTDMVHVKWPNDVLVSTQKISGILLQTQHVNTHTNYVLIGIGINLNSAPCATEVQSTIHSPTSLATVTGKFFNPLDAMVQLTSHLQTWLSCLRQNGLAYVMDIWRERSFGLNAMGQARLENEVVKGRFRTVEDDGGLVIDTKYGVRKIYTGEVFVT